MSTITEVNMTGGNKRALSDSSSTGETPPAKVKNTTKEVLDFTSSLIIALSDPTVVETLAVIINKSLQAQIAEKDQQILDLQAEVNSLKAETTRLVDAVDELEQYGRRNAVRIWSKTMPEHPGENTDQLVMAYAMKIGVELPPNSIGRSHRVGRPRQGQTRPIIVKFTSYNVRRMLYNARKTCNDVYVSEDLTRKRSNIFYKSRLERNVGRFKHCWTSDGRIHIRLHDDSMHVVTTLSQLDKLIDDTPIPEPRDHEMVNSQHQRSL